MGSRSPLLAGTAINLLGLVVLVLCAAACLTALPGGTQAPGESSSPPLQGTSWQLVRFQGGDDSTLTPDERAKYTIEFGADGQLAMRVDCNRGRGTWTSNGPSQLQFGPLALTRAACPPGSLHGHIVKQWGYIRSYVMQGGRLFLSLLADGGIYEFEPVKTTNP